MTRDAWDACRKTEAARRKRHRQNRWVKALRKRVALEATLERCVVDYVECGLGLWALKVGRDGWPDRLVLLGTGRHCWFELKRRKFGHLTPAQRRRIPALRRVGEHVYIIQSFEQAKDALLREGAVTQK